MDYLREPFSPQYEKEELPTEWQEKARDVLKENPETREKSIEQLTVFGKCHEFNDILNKGLMVRFLRAANWDLETAKSLITSFWNFVSDFPDCLENSLPSRLENVWRGNLISCSSIRDKSGTRMMMLHKMGNWNPAEISPIQFLAGAFTVLQLLSMELITQVAGVTITLNAEGFSLKHLRFFGPRDIRCLASILNGAVPIWIRKFHIVNHPRVFGIFFNLVKPFLNERIRDNIVFHSSIPSLHQYIGDPQFLSTELGGVIEVTRDLEKATRCLESDIKKLIKFVEKQ